MIQAGLEEAANGVRAFTGFLGDRLSADRRRVYEKFLAALPRLLTPQRAARLTAGKAVTLVHGDAHFWNFLYPHEAAQAAVHLIDWQSWDIGVGTDDLAYMIALHWYPERRRELERALISRYHQELLRQGVTNYTWPECWLDYRVSAAFNLLVPAGLWSIKAPAAIWWSHLERALWAFHDLGGDELLAL